MRAVTYIRGLATVACLVAGLVGIPVIHAEDSSSVQAKWDAITRCAPLVEDGARHACLDEVLRKSGLMPDEAAAAASRRRVGLPAQVVPVPAVAAPVAAPATPGAKRPREEPIEVTLAGVKRGGDGTLVLDTTEGAVWRQVENTALHPQPMPGETLTIKHGLFGGYMCQSRKWVVFRCVRMH